MDPEELARQLVAKVGRDEAVRALRGSRDPEDRAVLAAIESRGQGRGFLGTALGVGRQVGSGLGEVLPTAALGVAGLVPGQQPGEAGLRSLLDRRRAETAPQSGLEAVARIGSRIAGEGALATVPGGAASRALGVSRFAGSALAGAGVGGAIAAAGPEESTLGAVGQMTGSEGIQRAAENPFIRAGTEAAASVGGDIALRGLGGILRRMRGQKAVEARIPELEQAAERVDGPLSEVFSDTATDYRESLTRARVPDVNVDIDAELNIPKWSGGDEALAEEIRKAGRMAYAEHGPDLKGFRSREMVEQAAREFEISPQDLLGKKAVDMSDAEFLALRNLGNSQADRAAKAAQTLNDPAALPEEKLLAELDYRQAHDFLERGVYQHLVGQAEVARTLASMRYVGKKSGSPFTWLTEATRVAGRELTDVERETVLRLARESQADPNAFGKLTSAVARLRESTVLEKAQTIWKAGLLYLPTTHFANLVGNTTMAVLETAKDVPAFVVDRALSALTRNRTKALSTGQVTGSMRGLVEGTKKGWRVVRGDILPSLDKIDVPRQVNFDSAFWQTYTQIPFRFLSGSDQAFHEAAFMRSLYEQAVLLTKKAGLGGTDQVRRVSELIQNPPDEMVLEGISRLELATARKTAEEAALVSTFRNRGAAAEGAGSIKRGINKLTGGVAGEFVVPFTTTPANVAARVFEASPVGFIAGVGELTGRGLMKLLKGSAGLTPEVQKRIAETIGRSTVGSAPIVAGMALAHAGRMTGQIPQGESERDQFYLEGKLPNAVYINGKWRSFERLSPAGNLVILGGEMYRQFADPTQSRSGAVAGSAMSGLSTLTRQPFLTGPGQLIGAVTDPERQGGRMVEGLAGSVTGPLGGVARAVDPTIRESEGPGEAIQARIPFVSRGLPAKVNQYGEPVQRQPRGLRSLVDPLRSTADRRDDTITQELSRLGIRLTNRDRYQRIETGHEFEGRATEEGQALRAAIERVVNSRGYENSDDEWRRGWLERVIKRERDRQTERLKRAHDIESLAGVE